MAVLTSMTGFGRAEAALGERTLVVEIRSVNNRHLDVSPRLPRELWHMEAALRRTVQESVRRGRVEVHVTVADRIGRPGRSVSVDRELLQSAIAVLKDACAAAPIDFEPPSVGHLLALPGLFISAEEPEPLAGREEAVADAVARALQELVAMRRNEGETLHRHLERLGGRMQEIWESLAAAASGMAEAQREKLTRRLARALGDGEASQERIALEIALWADKTSVEEELNRLQSHLDQYRSLLAADGESVGRRLEFLVQEMHREMSTIGAKAPDHAAEAVLAGKHVLEQMREQLQNVE